LAEKQDEVRWEFGERVYENNSHYWLPFILVHAGVLLCMHAKRLFTRCAVSARSAFYVRLHRWSARGVAANSNRPGSVDPG
jgi:hypothetical protein